MTPVLNMRIMINPAAVLLHFTATVTTKAKKAHKKVLTFNFLLHKIMKLPEWIKYYILISKQNTQTHACI